jgi:multidrug efflux pump
VLVVGMAVGTIFTLYVVPAFYMLIARDHAKERTHAPEVAATPVLAK